MRAWFQGSTWVAMNWWCVVSCFLAILYVLSNRPLVVVYLKFEKGREIGTYLAEHDP